MLSCAYRLRINPLALLALVTSVGLTLPWLSVSGQSLVGSEDEAFYAAYGDGWQTGDNGGRGFGAWRLFAPQYATEETEQYAGFFVADVARESDLNGSAREGKAFGIFANGTGFEETFAFRPFDRPLAPGDVFSLLLEFGGFASKFDQDATETSSVGVELRTEGAPDRLEREGIGRTVAVAIIEGLSTYQILDADGRFNTRVFVDPEGAEIGFTLRPENRYDLRIRTLGRDAVHRFPDRRRRTADATEGGEQGAATARSFATFNLNGGRNNLYFGALQVSRDEGNFR